jgi:hypothetical protein
MVTEGLKQRNEQTLLEAFFFYSDVSTKEDILE